MKINDKELARIYYDHHASQTNARSQRRLTDLMRQAAKHDRKCTTAGCPLSLHSFIAGDVTVHTMFNEELLKTGTAENDEARQQMLGQRYVVRIYFPQVRRAHTGVFLS